MSDLPEDPEKLTVEQALHAESGPETSAACMRIMGWREVAPDKEKYQSKWVGPSMRGIRSVQGTSPFPPMIHVSCKPAGARIARDFLLERSDATSIEFELAEWGEVEAQAYNDNRKVPRVEPWYRAQVHDRTKPDLCLATARLLLLMYVKGEFDE